MEEKINKSIVEVVKHANYMIPVEWEQLYINIEIDNTYSGGWYFFYKYEGEYHYYWYIGEKFNIPEKLVRDAWSEGYDKAMALKKIFLEELDQDWSSCTIYINENRRMEVNFDYTPWDESDFGPSARISYFQYKHLGKEARDERELKKFLEMKKFESNYKI